MGLFNFNNKKKQENKSTPAERYLQHLDTVFQQEPIFHNGGKGKNKMDNVSVMIYKDVPEEGFITGITYGLSLFEHPQWKFGRPELCISVESTDENWARVAGFIANQLGGDCPFSYGQAINFGQQVAEESEMDAFFVFAPSTLDKEDCLDIEVGADYKINIVGLYPMYSDELKAFGEMGLEQFWHHPNFNNYAVNRDRITKIE